MSFSIQCAVKAAFPLVIIWICCGCPVKGESSPGKFIFDLSSTKKCAFYSKTLDDKSMIKINVKDHKEKQDITLSWVARRSGCVGRVSGLDHNDALDYNQLSFKEPWLNFDEPMPGQYTGSDCDDHQKSNNWQDISTAPFRQQTEWWPVNPPSESRQNLERRKRDYGAKHNENNNLDEGRADSTDADNIGDDGWTDDWPDSSDVVSVEESYSDSDSSDENPILASTTFRYPFSTPLWTTRPYSTFSTYPTSTSAFTSPQTPFTIVTYSHPPFASWQAHTVTQVPAGGTYLVYICIGGDIKDHVVQVTLEMKSEKGYLSAPDYPLLSFYMIMCILYVLLGVTWLALSVRNRQYLVRNQFCIGVVILLGLIEKFVLFSLYNSANITGDFSKGADKFAGVVSSLKSTVARMFLIVVSLGFGTVKPHQLGRESICKVLAVGILFFIVSTAEVMFRNHAKYIFLPQMIIDSAIFVWICVNLKRTMKMLRNGEFYEMLAWYRYFFITFILCVVATVALVVWGMILHSNECITDWSKFWIVPAAMHILFSMILVVMMILWRPNAHNQRNVNANSDQVPMIHVNI